MPTLPSPTPIQSVKTDQPVVALTFDDGPHETHTTRMLELFARENIKVTFFEVGNSVAHHPALARDILAAGHEIGNHSRTHPKLGEMADVVAVRAELVDSQTIIREATGFTPVVFRAPYISHGPALWTVLDELNLPSVSSKLFVGDWDAAITEELITERSSQAEAGDVIILHTWQAKTLDALPEIIRRLRVKGLRFVTVSELLALTPSS